MYRACRDILLGVVKDFCAGLLSTPLYKAYTLLFLTHKSISINELNTIKMAVIVLDTLRNQIMTFLKRK